MTAVELARAHGRLLQAAYECREAQKAYFANRTNCRLRIAKDAERRLDRELVKLLHPEEAGLFPEQEGG